MQAEFLQSYLTLRNPVDCSPPGSSVTGKLQVRILERKKKKKEYWSGLPFPSPGDLPDPGTEPMSLIFPALAGGIFTTSTTWEAKLIFEICHHLSFDLAVCGFWSYTLKFQFGSQILSRVIPQGKYTTVTKRGM